MSTSPPPAPHALHYGVLAVGLLVLTAYGSVVPLWYRPLPYEQAVQRLLTAPWYDPTATGARADWVVNGVQNAALGFAVMGALAVGAGLATRLVLGVVVAPLLACLGLVLEFVQVYFPPRTVSRNDILVEALGGLAGVAAFVVVGPAVTRWARRMWNVRGREGLAWQVLPAYVVGLLVLEWMPFDLAVSWAELEAKWGEGRVALVPFGGLGSAPGDWIRAVVGWGVHAAAYAPLGLLLAWLPARLGIGRGTVLVAALNLTNLVELGQLFIMSRHCDVTDVLVGTLGVLAGWELARWADRSPGLARAWRALQTRLAAPGGGATRAGRGVLAGVLAAWAVGLGLAHLWPLEFTADPARFLGSDAALSDEHTPVRGIRRFSWAPGADYYWGSRYQALDQFARRGASFAPVGILLALGTRRTRRGVSVAVVLVAGSVAGAIEVAQYFQPARHPSTTDWLVQVSGAVAGYLLTRHLQRVLGEELAPAGAAIRGRGAAAVPLGVRS